ncbi:dihydroxy-acid dehydratase [Photobacterium sp. ZSDE20]|uniref:Dihydroxy-acid dehydratase n=1 Tax=Photobacterium pectinilyticum TaxID=2906793 RepID=A0ABT1N6L9_9GAMM|nr:IlvD/Edd family dehydratase [Photobacterium sp. ZSDE20]MCQ1058884.1 dihydroxy-acid dehydratase [Photobacterium sp. ZSDE20]MDD1823826.1 dihydroxy-acid dehydratase [Photobacterium sp. ZSDE20]
MKKTHRSQEWFGRADKSGFISRSWMKNQGYPNDIFDGRPVIGICNTWSDLTPCNAHLRDLAERVKYGVLEAGGVPFEFPAMSLGEALMKPTTMLYRNLASMDVEESIRANPIDGVVLLVNCDKTTPSCLMGAASVDIPTIAVSGGAMLNGKYKGRDIGSGTDLWKFSEELRSGIISQDEFDAIENSMSRSNGACNTMGTASSMACMVEALGMTLPNGATIPAVDAERRRIAQLAGRRIVGMVKEDLRISHILTREALENAIMCNAAIGGSTNFILHLQAIAGRLGIPLDLTQFDKLSADIPLMANLKPSGDFLMEDFHYAGGLGALITNLQNILHKQVIQANGKTLQENYASFPTYNDNVISTFERPFQTNSGTAVLKGSLAPSGAIIKTSAASPELLSVKQKCYVFENIEQYNQQINAPDLPVDQDTILVLKDAGVKGYPGMPEVGNFGLPKKLLQQGVRDMVRISDGRMSGTAFGTIVLHVSPESADGGPLAHVQTGDVIEMDVAERKLNLCISDEELTKRKESWAPPSPKATRGYAKLYINTVQPSHLGGDLDFLVGGSGSEIKREPHPE